MKLNSLFSLVAPIVVALTMVGCGEIISQKSSTITGRITDENGLPVRDARVFTLDSEGRSTANGAYVLSGNREDFISVFAEITQNGVLYKGRNVVRTSNSAAQLSLNIVVAPSTSLARMQGTIRFNSNPVSGARVYAYAPGYLSSAVAVTDDFGNYSLNDLVAGKNYEISAGKVNFKNAETTLNFTAGEVKTVNFNLAAAGAPILPTVVGITTRSWVSPRQSRSPGDMMAYESIKQLIDPERVVKLASRSSSAGQPIEVELNWNRLTGVDFAGYGVYRGIGFGTITDYDYYKEPLSGTYIDGDRSLLPNQLYRYQLTATDTSFPNFDDSEGPRSAIAEARTLNDLFVDSVSLISPNGVRFNWQSGSGATTFVVFIFDRFPGIGVTSIYNNQSSPTSNLFLDYNGSGLIRGRTYNYLVLGLANSNNSRTLSTIGQFTY